MTEFPRYGLDKDFTGFSRPEIGVDALSLISVELELERSWSKSGFDRINVSSLVLHRIIINIEIVCQDSLLDPDRRLALLGYLSISIIESNFFLKC